jgi:hypothetical protein
VWWGHGGKDLKGLTFINTKGNGKRGENRSKARRKIIKK